MSKRPHQGYTVFQMLKAAKPGQYVTRNAIAKQLNVKEGSVGVYLYGLKKLYNIETEVVKQGRTVLGYKLVDPNAEMSANGRRGVSAATKTTKPKTKSKVTVAKTKTTQVKTKSKNAPVEIEDLEVEEITDTELSDIKSQLGLA